MAKGMDSVHKLGQMDQSMRDSGKMIKLTARVNSFTPMAMPTKGNG